MRRAARAIIHLDHLHHNYLQVKQAAPHSRVMAVVKANAYGHGLVNVARTLAEADAFAVTTVAEAVQIRDAGVDQPILCLQGFYDEAELREASERRVCLTLHHEDQLRILETARLNIPVSVWLKFDSGMHRLGFPIDQASTLYQRVRTLPAVRSLPDIMTHLACADDAENPYTDKQLQCFDRATADLPGECSIANSAAILAWPNSHRHWVRPGIMLYGVSPFSDTANSRCTLKPVMTLRAPLISIKNLNEGDTIGYGCGYVCAKAMRVAVVAIGYGDGYPRHARTHTPVLVNGRRAPLLGRVSMDMISVDVSDIECRTGDMAELWGEALSVNEVAYHAGTISYELLCAVGGDIVRNYSA